MVLTVVTHTFLDQAFNGLDNGYVPLIRIIIRINFPHKIRGEPWWIVVWAVLNPITGVPTPIAIVLGPCAACAIRMLPTTAPDQIIEQGGTPRRVAPVRKLGQLIVHQHAAAAILSGELVPGVGAFMVVPLLGSGEGSLRVVTVPLAPCHLAEVLAAAAGTMSAPGKGVLADPFAAVVADFFKMRVALVESGVSVGALNRDGGASCRLLEV